MRLAVIVLLVGAFSTVQGQQRVFESGPLRTHLIELFTSQGCSSCPPAEAWLSKLKSDAGLWTNVVPIAFHVDYWDRLGWRDPFASKDWTARQYQYSARWNSQSVYTPGFVLDGREWTDPKVPTAGNDRTGVLSVTLQDGKLVAEFKPVAGATNATNLYVATLGFDLTSNVTAGENRGRDLRQDFVVLSLARHELAKGRTELAFTPEPRAGAVAAWVTAPNELAPIQATGGWLKQTPQARNQ